MTDTLPIRIDSLRLHPVKSCAGFAVEAALIVETGFDLDRTWMVVDGDGVFVSQRELPRLALVRTALRGSNELVLRAPGMLALHVALDRVEAETTVTVWNDRLRAWDMGPLAAQWFTDFLGRPLRLARHEPGAQRAVDPRYAGDVPAEAAFQDAYPLLVVSTASLAAINERLSAAGAAAVDERRFRPNIVLCGLDAHGEDHLRDLVFPTGEGAVHLRLVKPCTRCTIPDVDPDTGIAGHAVGDALRACRADPRLDGRVTFGMNAIVVEGIDRTLRRGLDGTATIAFD